MPIRHIVFLQRIQTIHILDFRFRQTPRIYPKICEGAEWSRPFFRISDEAYLFRQFDCMAAFDIFTVQIEGYFLPERTLTWCYFIFTAADHGYVVPALLHIPILEIDPSIYKVQSIFIPTAHPTTRFINLKKGTRPIHRL